MAQQYGAAIEIILWTATLESQGPARTVGGQGTGTALQNDITKARHARIGNVGPFHRQYLDVERRADKSPCVKIEYGVPGTPTTSESRRRHFRCETCVHGRLARRLQRFSKIRQPGYRRAERSCNFLEFNSSDHDGESWFAGSSSQPCRADNAGEAEATPPPDGAVPPHAIR